MSGSIATQPPAKLERLGRYRIVRPLSKGGMALVYEARRESLAGVSPRVAIKLILPDYASSDTFQELFINEARLGASMQHQNLVQIQDFDRDGDHFFLVMEYVEGLTLRRMIALCVKHGYHIPQGVIAEIGRQACDGLHYAHGAGDEQGRPLDLVHRDIKPSNLILNPQGVAKILDFGISKGRLMRERKGAVKGTWGYMAPEQAMGLEVGAPSDVFGLGTVLYEMAALHPLFKGKTPDEIKRLLLDDHAVRMAALLDPAYVQLMDVLLRALQRDPKARFQTAADFGRALSALLPDPITARDEVTRFYHLVSALHEGLPVPSDPRTGQPVTASQASLVGSHYPRSASETSSGWIVVGVTGATVLALVVVGVLLVVGGSAIRSAVRAPSAAPPEDVAAAVEPRPAADEPAGPAGEGAPGEEEPPPIAQRSLPTEARRAPRPPPAVTIPPSRAAATMPEAVTPEPEEEPVKVVVVRRDAGAVEAVEEPVPVPEPEPVPSEPVVPGVVTISAYQPAEVFIDGKFVRRTPVLRYELEPGKYPVLIRALDGRRKLFDIEVDSGETVSRVWDFDRGEWRR